MINRFQAEVELSCDGKEWTNPPVLALVQVNDPGRSIGMQHTFRGVVSAGGKRRSITIDVTFEHSQDASMVLSTLAKCPVEVFIRWSGYKGNRAHGIITSPARRVNGICIKVPELKDWI